VLFGEVPVDRLTPSFSLIATSDRDGPQRVGVFRNWGFPKSDGRAEAYRFIRSLPPQVMVGIETIEYFPL